MHEKDCVWCQKVDWWLLSKDGTGMISVCQCVEFTDGFLNLGWWCEGGWKPLWGYSTWLGGKALPRPPSFTFLQFSLSPSSPSFISLLSILSHSPATLLLLSPLACLSPPSVVSLSNFPYSSSPLFLCSLFPLPWLSSCQHSSVTAVLPVLPLPFFFFFFSHYFLALLSPVGVGGSEGQ